VEKLACAPAAPRPEAQSRERPLAEAAKRDTARARGDPFPAMVAAAL
jgi:hypothetical protein